MVNKKIIIGTAQFGLDYGISNDQGQVAMEEVQKILAYSGKIGITTLDTAPAYGSSEEVLGKINVVDRFKVSTKVDVKDPMKIRSSVLNSLKRLRRKRLDYFFVHDENLLLGEKSEEYYLELHRLKVEGLIAKIGVSSYYPEKLNDIVGKFEINVVQVPVNIFDQSFIKNNFLHSLKSRNIEIHARSIFMQGLVFIDPARLNPFFQPVLSKIEAFNKFCQTHKCSKLSFAFNFVNSLKIIDGYVLGVQSTQNLREINDIQIRDIPINNFRELDFCDVQYSKPFNWALC